MASINRLLPIASALLLLGLALLLVPSTLHLVPSVRGSTKTIYLIGNYPYWNSSNPTITVTQGDTITIHLSSGDGSTHQFLVDLDKDPTTRPDTSDCPTVDPCSGMFSPSSPIPPYAFTIPTTTQPGTYQYICVIHYPSMVGNFIVQAAPPTPDFSIAASPPAAVNVGASATSTISITALNGFASMVSLTDTAPAGLTCGAITPNSISGSGTATLSCSSTTTNTFSVTITGTSGSLTHSASLTFTYVMTDFTITATSPASVNAGQSATSTITITSLNGFSGTVSLTDTVPSGLTCGAITPSSVSGSGSATVACIATLAQTYNVTVTGASGSQAHSKTASFTFSTSSPSSGTGNLPVAALAGAVVVIIAAAGVAVYLVRRRTASK